LANASGIILVHNHPSGDPSPSEEDHNITEQMREAGKILGIKLIDHVIIGEGSYYSFEAGRTFLKG
jgi:DNA repair protein RadC